MNVTKEDKPTLQQKRTRNRKRSNSNNIKEGCRGDATSSRGRRKGAENLKKKEDKTVSDTNTKPVIGSSNPFFIAVCAPETYKPNSSPVSSSSHAGSGVGNQRIKPNVFLRSRPRSSSTGGGGGGGGGSSYPNHFIHHPALQHSRQVTTAAGSTSDSQVDAPVGGGAPSIISSSDLHHFPSLGGLKAQDAAGTTAKLNFKEMMMRTTAAASACPTPCPSVSSSVPVVLYSKQSTIIPQKSLSTSNIFLAAFHHPDDHDNDDGYSDDANNAHTCGSVVTSSVLIDSCDKKYDRLYK